MRFIYNNKEYRIWFKYTTVDGKRGIICYISETLPAGGGPPYLCVSQGWSACVEPEDHFVKEKGRKIALTRAVKNPFMRLGAPDDKGVQYWESFAPNGFDYKQFRTAAWNAYLNRARSNNAAA
jgi:hypothetical protein